MRVAGLQWIHMYQQSSLHHLFVRLSIKESLFPVHRVGEIEASREAAFFFPPFFFFGRKVLSIFGIFFVF